MTRRRLLTTGLMLLAWSMPAAAGKLALSTIEGEVISIQRHAGEAEVELLAVELALAGEAESMLVLLAPEAACDEIGFEVSEGDRLRAKIFVPDDGPAAAHKVLNLSRGTMVRLRTLRSVPLWTAAGVWQGGASRAQPGNPTAPRHRGAGPGSGAGPGRGG